MHGVSEDSAFSEDLFQLPSIHPRIHIICTYTNTVKIVLRHFTEVLAVILIMIVISLSCIASD